MSEFNLDPEAINRYVAEKIIESSLGNALKEAIDDEINRISKSYDNPMKQVIAAHLSEVAREYLQTPEVKERLRVVVESKLTDDALETFIGKIITEGYRH